MSSSFITNNMYLYMDEASINQLLKCKLCLKPFVDPVRTQTGDTFCRTCIVGVLKRRPVVNRTFSSNDDTENNESFQQIPTIGTLTPVTERLLLEMLASLLVRCTKCGQPNLKRGELEEHLNTICTQATVLCNAAGIKCSWVGARDELDEHMDACKFEPLRPALEFVLNENSQLKSRLDDLEATINELLTIKNMKNMNFDS